MLVARALQVPDFFAEFVIDRVFASELSDDIARATFLREYIRRREGREGSEDGGTQWQPTFATARRYLDVMKEDMGLSIK